MSKAQRAERHRNLSVTSPHCCLQSLVQIRRVHFNNGVGRLFVVLVLWILCVPSVTRAQVPDTVRQGIQSPGPDTNAVMGPTAPSPAAPASSDKKIVNFSASDSLVIIFDEENGDQGTLVGNAKVTYGEANLDAHTVDILFEIDELRANGLPSDTGMIGRPHFQRGEESFYGDRLAYNLNTQRGRVVGARTNLDEGFVAGQVVKVDESGTAYLQGGTYTTCNCVEDPSYSLRAEKMKVVDQKWVYTGPIQLYIFNIPTPLWLPFGFLPYTEGRRTGPLPPNYGEDERGFYLRDWGWYFAINDYMDFQLRFGIWTKGSWQISPLYRYRRRDRYGGQLQLDYIHNRTGEKGDPNYQVVKTSSLRWSHDQTISPFARFTSNVNLSSANYMRTISENYDDRVAQTIQSSIRYDKTWSGTGRRLGLNLSQQQHLATGSTSMTIPGLSFSQTTRKPFARENRVGEERWYERISYTYSGRLDNRYSFNRLSEETLLAKGDTAAVGFSWWDGIRYPSRYRRATGDDTPFDFRAEHNIPVSAYFSINRIPVINKTFRLNFSTNVNYSEDWFIRTIRRQIDSTGTVQEISIPGFFAHRQYSTGISANTTFYGLFPFRVWRFNGFRHTVRPSVSMSYSPDYTSDFWGYTRTYTNLEGEEIPYSIVPGGSSLGGRQQTLSFSVSNELETKLAETDSTGDSRSRTLKLLNLDLNTGYNFAAESFRMSDISLNARTNIGNDLYLTFQAGFSPYRLNDAGNQRIDSYVFNPLKFKFARLTRMSFTARTSFSSPNSSPGRPVSTSRAAMGGIPMGAAPFDDPGSFTGDPFDTYTYNSNSPVGYADFAIPWSLNLDFSYNMTKPFLEARRTALVNAAFDFNLTPNWKLQGRTGYDIARGEFVTTNLAIFRDFDCWEMSFNWIPFGTYQSYGFDLHVKSGKLRDILRIRQPRSDVKDRFGRLLN